MKDIAASVTGHLDRLGVDFERIACDPALADTAAFCEHYGYPLDRSANAIVVASRAPEPDYAVCVVLATQRLDVNGTVRRRLGARKASFADPEAVRILTGMEIGGVTVAGLPEGVPLWVDARIAELDWVIVGGGDRSLKLKIPPSAFERLGAEWVEGLAK